MNELLAAALGHYRAERWGQAHSLISEALRRDPGNAAALHLKGLLLARTHPEEAIELLERSIALAPGVADFPFNLAKLHHARGEFGKAVPLYLRAMELDPANLAARVGVAEALVAAGHPAEAVRHQRIAITMLENAPAGSEAETGPSRLARLWHAHALLLRNLGKLDAALEAHRRAIELTPAYAGFYNDLGITFAATGDSANAAACFEEALRLEPNAGDAAANLAIALRDQGKLSAAIDAGRAALALAPASAGPLNLLGNAFKDQAKLDDALSCFRRAIAVEPGNRPAHDNLLYTMLYHPDYPAKVVFEEHLKWGEAFEKFFPPAGPGQAAQVLDASAGERKVRVGYVSPDFRHHPLGLLIEPLLACHDHSRFTVICYSDAKRTDAVTERIKGHADFFQATAALSDEALAERVRRDGVDILVDLSSHMAGNRLAVFARKPAPVQASYLAYPYTTGLRAIDYLFSDKYLHPDEALWHHTETLYRLGTYWGAYPGADAVEVGDGSPFARNGFVTFGSLNNFCKLNAGILGLWRRILAEVAGARLVLLVNSSPDDAGYAREMLAAAGIDVGRVALAGKLPRERYLQMYRDIDIVLDPYPCNGHTTSLDALYMSRPVVTRVGEMPFSRAGLSQLTTVGHAELIARDGEAYVRTAVELARDEVRLSRYHQSLRKEFLASALNDPRGQTRAIEAAYRTMWRTYCAGEARVRGV